MAFFVLAFIGFLAAESLEIGVWRTIAKTELGIMLWFVAGPLATMALFGIYDMVGRYYMIIRVVTDVPQLRGLAEWSPREYAIPLGRLSRAKRDQAELFARRARAATRMVEGRPEPIGAGLARVTTRGEASRDQAAAGKVGRTPIRAELGKAERATGEIVTLRKLGQGAMATVFLAKDQRLGREVAIKVLHENRLGDQEAVARFEREARIVASLEHPNILGLYGIEELERGRFGLLMPYIKGGTLANRLREERGGLPLQDVVKITQSILKGLSYAHGRGIVHRDIKPANVFLDNETDCSASDRFGRIGFV